MALSTIAALVAVLVALVAPPVRADDPPATDARAEALRVPSWARTGIPLDAGTLELGASMGPELAIGRRRSTWGVATAAPQGTVTLRYGVTEWLQIDGLVPVWIVPAWDPRAPRISFGASVARLQFGTNVPFFAVPYLRAAVSWVGRSVALTLQQECACGLVRAEGILPQASLQTSVAVQVRLNDVLLTRVWASASVLAAPPGATADLVSPGANPSGGPTVSFTGPTLAYLLTPTMRFELAPVVTAGSVLAGKSQSLDVGLVLAYSWMPRVY